MKWIWNPVTAWNVSSWVTIFQMAWFREVFPEPYNWFMDFAGPPVSYCWGHCVDFAVAAKDIFTSFVVSS